MSKLEEGKKLFNEDKFEEASSLFTAYLSENDNHGDALFFRGLCYRKLKNFQESINDLTALITRLPEEADLYSERGVSYYHLKDYKTALLDMDKAVELQPENPYRYSSRAYIKAYLDVDGAILDYEKATQLDPQDEIAYNNLGLLLERRGKLKQAQQKFKRSNNLIGYNPEKRQRPIAEENKIETEKTKKIETTSSVGKVMLAVFNNQNIRKEYFDYLKNLFKRND
jgi:tetratricopeptide (TPR) repeat protein